MILVVNETPLGSLKIYGTSERRNGKRKRRHSMRRLGISIYPEHSTKEKDFAYMEMAAKYGFSRIFTCLLSVNKPKDEMIEEFKEFMDKAHELGFEVAVDTNPKVFEHLGATATNLKPFADMHVDIVRLDMSFGAMMDAMTTQNPYGLKIEFNGSTTSDNVEAMLHMGARQDQMLICHNFYPQKYTALDWDLFMNFSRNWNRLGFTTAAFVSSHNDPTFGPWEVYAGLPTCEIHRNMPIDLQARHLFATGLIDDVIIGNAYATEEELKSLGGIDLNTVQIKIDLADTVTEEEKNLLFNHVHSNRGDYPSQMVRSSFTRMLYRETSIPHTPCDKEFFTRGDVCVINDNLKHYRAEVQIILEDIPNDGERNLVGRIPEEELCILEHLKGWKKFNFIK